MTPATIAPAETELERSSFDQDATSDPPWLVVVWDDPVNLMRYVTLVFQKVFGYSSGKASRLMLQIHEHGHAVVARGTLEKAEHDVARLHAHGLWASMRKA